MNIFKNHQGYLGGCTSQAHRLATPARSYRPQGGRDGWRNSSGLPACKSIIAITVSRCMGFSTLSHAGCIEGMQSKSTTRQAPVCQSSIRGGSATGMRGPVCRVSRKASTQASAGSSRVAASSIDHSNGKRAVAASEQGNLLGLRSRCRWTA